MSPKAIEVRELTKTYAGGTVAVKGISFEVEPGEVFGLLGPNGAGKSTTIGVLTTTLRATSGSVFLAGLDVASQPLAARRISSVVFQEPVVDRSFTGRQNMALHARLWGVDAARIGGAATALGVVDLLDRPVAGYSGGERRRLEIARALVSGPRVLFLDEPSVGLDPRIRAELLDTIGRLGRREGVTILLTTHYLDEAERLCDRIAIMHAGRIVAEGTPAELRAQLGDELLELQVDGDAEAILHLLETQGIAGEDAFVVGSTVAIPLRSPSAWAISAVHELGVPATAVSARPPTLDDVYLRLTGGRLAA